jgi:two-component system response regulator FixJ
MNRGHLYLLDDDRARRARLAKILDEQCYAVREFDDAAAFLGWIDYERIPNDACIVTQLALAPINGVELLDVLHADRVTLPTVLIATASDIQLATKSMRYGTGYVIWWPFPESLLLDVVANVLREWNDAASNAGPIAELDHLRSIEDRFTSLSQRQRQVLRYVFEGNGNREIATALGISIKTVELHRAGMMKKMRADSVIALIRMMSDYHRAREQIA